MFNLNDDEGRIAPHSIDAEEAVLGSMLISPDAFFEVATFLQPDDFFLESNRWIYEAILAVHERGESVDNLTVIEELRGKPGIAGNTRLGSLGGSGRITYLINNTPTHIHAVTYAHLIERAATRRRLLKAAEDIAKTALDAELEIGEVVNNAEKALMDATTRKADVEFTHISEVASKYFNFLEARAKAQDEPIGIPTGFYDLDRIFNMRRGDLIILAGRPGMGKTSFALCVALNAARIVRARVGILSLEMKKQELYARLNSMEIGMPVDYLEKGDLSTYEWEQVVETATRLGKLPIFIEDFAGKSISTIRKLARRLQREHGLDMLIVDYVQRMISDEKNEQNREREIAAISNGLKDVAHEFDIPVLALAQLNRNVENRSDKRPFMADLRDSGALEQDADGILFIYRDEVYNPYTDKPSVAEIIIGKNRKGETGTVELGFKAPLTKFENHRIDLRDYSPGSYPDGRE